LFSFSFSIKARRCRFKVSSWPEFEVLGGAVERSGFDRQQPQTIAIHCKLWCPSPAPLVSRIIEVVRIDALEGEGADGGDADAVLDHELCEALAVDEDDFVLHAARVIEGAFVEVAGDEDAFVGMLPGQRADEALDGLAPDGALPALGLDVDDIQPEAVFVDDAVDEQMLELRVFDTHNGASRSHKRHFSILKNLNVKPFYAQQCH
jgi:hypothetical protein